MAAGTDVDGKMQGLGADPIGSSSQELSAFLKTEITRRTKVIHAAHISVD